MVEGKRGNLVIFVLKSSRTRGIVIRKIAVAIVVAIG
jgi:hypothetical protein